ncbi:hypothetical protein IAU60_005805 [Kwoniella sp. DSM 27419]
MQQGHDGGNHHGNTHTHSHGHGHGHDADHWNEKTVQDYLDRPGIYEAAQVSHDSVVWALTDAGVDSASLSTLNLLEVGCGPGTVTPLYLETFASVHAIDTSPNMLKMFASRMDPESGQGASPHTDKLSYSLHSLSPSSPGAFSAQTPQLSPTHSEPERARPPKHAKFDVIVANLVFHHVDEPDPFMRGLTGLLAPGGWVVFTELGVAEEKCEDGQMKEYERLMREGQKTKDGSVNAPFHFIPTKTPAELVEMFESHGLTKAHAQQRGLLPVFGTDKPGVPCVVARGCKL